MRLKSSFECMFFVLTLKLLFAGSSAKRKAKPPNPEGPLTCDPNPWEANGSYPAMFFEGNPPGEYDRLTMYVNAECTNLPEVRTHPPGEDFWSENVSGVKLPSGKCIRFFDKFNCCGKHLDISHDSHDGHLINSGFNDISKSFRKVNCGEESIHPSDCKTTKTEDSFTAVFYEGDPHKGWESIALEVSTCCRNVPDIQTGPPLNMKWADSVSDVHLPEGKCLRVFDKPDCGGNSLDIPHNRKEKPDKRFVVNTGWNDRTKSFQAIPCKSVLEPCQTKGGVGGENFKATFFENSRTHTPEIQIVVDVKSTCTDFPTTGTGSISNKPWNNEISDVVLEDGKCVCLYDKPDCAGTDFYLTARHEKYLFDNGFNDKAKSYRTCNSGPALGDSAEHPKKKIQALNEDRRGEHSKITCPSPDVEKKANDKDEFGAFFANFYAEESTNSARVTLLVKSSCTNLTPNMATTLTHVGLPHGKCLTLFDKPNCAGNTVDFHYEHPPFHLKHSQWDNKAKSFHAIHCDVPCKKRPKVEGDSYKATFYTEESTNSGHANLPVKPSCSNLPPNLANTLTSVALPNGKCLVLYNKPNCCGRTLAYHFTHSTRHIKNAQWNDQGKSFHSRPCEYPGEKELNKESFQVVFHEAIERNLDTIGLDASSCCTNIPSKKTDHPGNSPWNEVVSDQDLPAGKCIRIFDKPNCQGKELDVAHNSKPRHMWDAGWDNRPKSFKAIPFEEVVAPCQSGYSADGEKFQAIFYEDRRGEHMDELSFDVTSTCANIPNTRTKKTSFLWPETITDVVVPWKNCICLFKKADCSGESMYTTLSQDKFHIQNTSFDNKIVSYRACNTGSTPSISAKAEVTNSGLAVFYDGAPEQKGRDSVGLEITDCTNIPSTKTKSPGNTPWTKAVKDVHLPNGKCIRLHDEADCGGKSIDIAFNGKDKKIIINTGWEKRAKSFVALPCGEVQDLCKALGDNVLEDTEVSFATKFYADVRSNHKGVMLKEEVTRVCANVPTTATGSKSNQPWNKEISDVEITNGNCICLFNQQDCNGDYIYMSLRPEKFVQEKGFKGKTKSYRACNMGLDLEMDWVGAVE